MADETGGESALDSVFSSSRDRSGKDAPLSDGQPRHEDGKYAPKEKPSEEAPPPVEAKEAKEPPPDDVKEPTEQRRMVPLDEVKSERAKRQEETRLRTEAENRSRQYEARIADMERRFHAQQNPPPPPPDFLTDPEGARSHLIQEVQKQAMEIELNRSERQARKTFGNEAVNTAFEYARAKGVINKFQGIPDAWNELVDWHQKAQKFDRIGDDPDEYEKRVRGEERLKVMAELKAGTAGGQAAQRFPGTLADATPASAQGQQMSEGSVLDSVFGSNRKRGQ